VCYIVVRLHCARFVKVRQHRESFGYCCVFFVSLDPSFLVSELGYVAVASIELMTIEVI